MGKYDDYTETDTREELINPALKAAGWGVVSESRIKREVIAPGKLIGHGKRASQDIADYVLIYKGHKLAVVEAKKASLPVTEGLAQAKRYAGRLKARFGYSTNGLGIYGVDMLTGEEGDIEKYPSPDELWNMTFSMKNEWRERFAAVPFEDGGGKWDPRYYQHNAISKVLEAIEQKRDRILLTLATGTGKTSIAFQLAWKLFHSRWNVKDWRDGSNTQKRPRILFLADRNILADQAFNSFSAFPEDALLRIDPKSIAKKGGVPKNGSIFFTIFQTFMSGRDVEGNETPNFGAYPKDFFDFIIIDECHRGGAKDESTWRQILEYFSPAVQLGLTATPKRQRNADTYAYFGEPVYVYSLKEGINDGFLTPFKVKQISTTIDDYRFTADDLVLAGEIDEVREYTEADFNKIIEIKAREEYRVKTLLNMINQEQKAIIFCNQQPHPLMIRDFINQHKKSIHPDYCVRVTALDGDEGDRFLKAFQDNDKTIPTMLTTSTKLSTGVDAKNVRAIVLLRPVESMIEFKQIIGRGTRLFEGKDFFTIYDFVGASKQFSDPEWDGDPIPPEPCKRCGNVVCTCIKEPPKPCSVCEQFPCICPPKPDDEDEECPTCGQFPCECVPEKREMISVKLADGKVRQIQHMTSTSYWGADGKPLSAAEFIEKLFGSLPNLFKSEDHLRELWGNPLTRKTLLKGLEELGYSLAQLETLSEAIDAVDSDIYDVLSYISFMTPAITRKERVELHKSDIFKNCTDKQREFLEFVLDHYISQGITELDVEKLPQLIDLKYHSIDNAIAELGPVTTIRTLFLSFQSLLYTEVA